MLGRQNYRHPLSLWNREGLFIKVTIRHWTVILVAGPGRRTVGAVQLGHCGGEGGDGSLPQGRHTGISRPEAGGDET